MSNPPVHHGHAPVVMSELEKERRMAIFVMRFFVPPEQQRVLKVADHLEFIMQQLRRSPIQPQFPIRPYSTTTNPGVSEINENSNDWQDLMQWTNASLLDTIESKPVHIFQWVRTHNYLTELRSGLMGTVVGSREKFEKQKKIINMLMQLHQQNKINIGKMRSNQPMNVYWILWKLRGFLATIPTPNCQTANDTANNRLLKFQAEMGLKPFFKFNHWINHNQEYILLYLATVCWFPAPKSQSAITSSRPEAAAALNISYA